MAHTNAGPTGAGSRRYRPRRGQEWQVSPASIAAQLKARGLLPALQGYKVVFSDLGIDIPGRSLRHGCPRIEFSSVTGCWADAPTSAQRYLTYPNLSGP